MNHVFVQIFNFLALKFAVLCIQKFKIFKILLICSIFSNQFPKFKQLNLTQFQKFKFLNWKMWKLKNWTEENQKPRMLFMYDCVFVFPWKRERKENVPKNVNDATINVSHHDSPILRCFEDWTHSLPIQDQSVVGHRWTI